MLLITAFPLIDGEELHWWQALDGDVIRHGCDADPRDAAGLADEDAQFASVALVPTAMAPVRWDTLDAKLTAPQAASAYAAEIARSSMGDAAGLHIATAATEEDGGVVGCWMARDELAAGLARLQLLAIDPDLVIPAGLAFPGEAEWRRIELPFETILRRHRAIAPDEPAIRAALIGDGDIATLDEGSIDAQLAALAGYAGPNLRSGVFAKRARRALTPWQKRVLWGLAIAASLLILLNPVVEIVKYRWQADEVAETALAAARTEVPEAPDLAEASRLLDAKLASQSRGTAIFSVPGAALWQAVQRVPGVTLNRLNYGADGAVATQIAAPSNDQINQVLIALQQAGYVVTAQPIGPGTADVTVRAP